MEGLTEFEQAVMDKLLGGDNPVLETLRRQAEVAKLVKRERTGVGFYCDFRIPESARTVGNQSFEIGDVVGEGGQLKDGMGFLLFVRDGRLKMLEGFSYDEALPDSLLGLSLRYTGTSNRGLDAVLRPAEPGP